MKQINTEKAPKAVGPYSQAIEADGFVYCSGQIAIVPESGEMVAGGIALETRQVIANLNAVLEAAGVTLADVVLANVYLTDMKDFADFNAVYGEAFAAEPKPARVTVGVAALPKNARVEITCVAVRKI